MNSLLPPAAHAELEADLRKLYHASFDGVADSPAHVARMAVDSLDEDRSREQLALFERVSGTPLAGKRVLELGAGVGLTVALARSELEAEAFGLEPGADEYGGTIGLAHRLLRACGLPPHLVLRGLGEDLPFPDACFDIVLSSNVLEHVADPRRVLGEALRVLRPGGYLHMVVPNYGSWWEGHYGFLWLPHMPLALAKLYVRLRGRRSDYLETLQFVTYGRLSRWLAPHMSDLEILGWGDDLWRERVKTLAFAEYAALGRLKKLLGLVHSLRLTTPLLAVGSLFHWTTPLVLTARRPARPSRRADGH